jgi:hypothetical protein
MLYVVFMIAYLSFKRISTIIVLTVMRTQTFQKGGRLLFFAVLLSMSAVGGAFADHSQSTHYQVNETQFGIGTAENACSTSYCAKQSAGDLVVGSGKSGNYSAQFGSNTSDQPYLAVIVTGGTTDMGVLDTNKTGTASATIKVRNYLSDGYSMQIAGDAPTQGIHHIKGMSTPSCPCTSQQGAEQWGINLAANTAPSLGASPVQVPDSTYSYGVVNDNYATPNLFTFDSENIVAHSNTSSGETDYKLSMILNVSAATPGGRYTSNFSAVVVATY